MSEINRVFSPEFRNRLDEIIWFNHLDMTVIAKVVDKFLVELQAQLDEKSVVLDVSDDARTLLAEKGYDKAMGARPMARVVTEMIKRPLADEILFGKLEKGGVAHVDVDGDKLTIKIEQSERLTQA